MRLTKISIKYIDIHILEIQVTRLPGFPYIKIPCCLKQLFACQIYLTLIIGCKTEEKTENYTEIPFSRLGAITWDLTGSKLVTGAADGSIKVRDSHRLLSLDIQSRGFGVNEKTIRVQSSL